MPENVKLVGPPAPHILETEIQGDISLYDARHEKVLVLNATASDVWRLCDGESTLDEIVDLLARAYQTGHDKIGPDVKLTIEQLVDAGFLPES